MILSELVASCSKMKQLNLSGNEIDHNTARTLISMAKKIDGLKKLNLAFNAFGSEWEGLNQHSKSILFLDVGNER